MSVLPRRYAQFFTKLAFVIAIVAYSYFSLARADESLSSHFEVGGGVGYLHLDLIESSNRSHPTRALITITAEIGTLHIVNPFLREESVTVAYLLLVCENEVKDVQRLGQLDLNKIDHKPEKLLLSSGAATGAILSLKEAWLRHPKNSTYFQVILLRSFVNESIELALPELPLPVDKFMDEQDSTALAYSQKVMLGRPEGLVAKSLKSNPDGVIGAIRVSDSLATVGDNVSVDCIVMNQTSDTLVVSRDLFRPLHDSKVEMHFISKKGDSFGDLLTYARKRNARDKFAICVPPGGCVGNREQFRAGTQPGIGFIEGMPLSAEGSLRLSGVTAYAKPKDHEDGKLLVIQQEVRDSPSYVIEIDSITFGVKPE